MHGKIVTQRKEIYSKEQQAAFEYMFQNNGEN